MKAIVQDQYGEADVLRLDEVEVPEIGTKEVLVRVHAAGVDRGAWHLMAGKPYAVRLATGVRAPRQRVRGLDLAGTVEAIGPEVTRFQVGDEVYGIGRGSFAELAAAREDKLAAKPANLTHLQACVVPVSGLTALQALHDAGRLQQGQRVLIVGASGGVGSFAVQLAKAAGAHVTGVCSTSKVGLVRSLGADDVVDYRQSDFSDTTGRHDLVVDTGGSTPLARLRRTLTPQGTLVIVGGEAGGNLTGLGRQLHAVAVSPFSRQRLTMMLAKEHYSGLERLTALIEAGQVVPPVDRSYPLARTPEAVRRLVAGDVRGKVGVTIPV